MRIPLVALQSRVFQLIASRLLFCACGQRAVPQVQANQNEGGTERIPCNKQSASAHCAARGTCWLFPDVWAQQGFGEGVANSMGCGCNSSLNKLSSVHIYVGINAQNMRITR